MADMVSKGLLGPGHFTSSKVSMDKDEPLYKNLFTVTLIPPPALGTAESQETQIVLEGIRSIGGLITQPGVGSTSQKYKWAERMFAGAAPGQTHLDLTINFALNMRPGTTSNDNYTYKFLRRWSDLVYDPLTGRMGIKQEYSAASMTVTMHDRRGIPFWQWICYNVFPTSQLPDPGLSYDETSLMEASMTFVSDYFDESIL